MSLLGLLVHPSQREKAATTALAYLIDPGHSPGMAKAFVDLLRRNGAPEFTPGGLDGAPSQRDDRPPALTLRDADGAHRVFVETTFWGDVDDALPERSLKQLPAAITGQFLDLVGSPLFEIGRIGSEWSYGKGVKPDIAIHEAGTGEVRVFVESFAG